MKISMYVVVPLLAIDVLLATSRAQSAPAAQVLFQNANWSNASTVPTSRWSPPPGQDREAADDFNAIGTITRVAIDGTTSGINTAATLNGVWVRFYDWTAGGVGNLSYQAFVPAGTPGLLFNATAPTSFDVPLPAPFQATGNHFVSLQFDWSGFSAWEAWVADYQNPTMSALRFRDNLVNGVWGPYANVLGAVNADLSIQIWGYPGTPPTLPIDPCGTWSVLSTPNVLGANGAGLVDIEVVDPGDVWAVGSAAVAAGSSVFSNSLAMHWNGTQWSIVPTPNPGAPTTPDCALYAVDSTGPQDVWAGGYQSTLVGSQYGPQVLIMRWDGTQWSVMPGTPVPQNPGVTGVAGSSVADIEAIGPNDVWFVGTFLDLPSPSNVVRPGLLTHWDGSSFTQTNLPIPNGANGQAFTAVSATATNDVWIVGGTSNSTNLGPFSGARALRFDGANWNDVTPPVPGPTAYFIDVQAIAPNDVWILGGMQTGPTSATFFLDHWNGTTWTVHPGPPLPGTMKVLSPTSIYVANQAIYRFDGTSWSTVQVFPSILYGGPVAVDAINPCELWAAGTQILAGTGAPFTARIDSPNYWSAIPRPGCSLSGAAGSLTAITAPRPGSTFTIGIDDPIGALSPVSGAAFTYWIVATIPSSGYPACGDPFPYGGIGQTTGELFVYPPSILTITGPVPWIPSLGPAPHSGTIPNYPGIVGFTVVTQGLLQDTGSPLNMILTNGLEVRIGY